MAYLARRIALWIHESETYELLGNQESQTVEEMIAKTFIIVLFRLKCLRGPCNDELVKRINGSGEIYVSGTQWESQKAARIAVSNWQADVERDGKIVEGVLESAGRCKCGRR